MFITYPKIPNYYFFLFVIVDREQVVLLTTMSCGMTARCLLMSCIRLLTICATCALVALVQCHILLHATIPIWWLSEDVNTTIGKSLVILIRI